MLVKWEGRVTADLVAQGNLFEWGGDPVAFSRTFSTEEAEWNCRPTETSHIGGNRKYQASPQKANVHVGKE